MAIEKASERHLVALRDRCGLLPPETAWQVLQRLTWIYTIPEAVTKINQAISDVEETDESTRRGS